MSELLEKIGWSLLDPLTLARVYYLRMSFAAKDLAVVTARCASYKSKWNSKYGHRFTIANCSVKSMEDIDVIVVEGKSKNTESFMSMRMSQFWAQHEHVENIHMIDAWYLGSILPTQPGEQAPPEPGAPGTGAGKIPVWLIVVGVLVLGIVGYMLFRKKRR